MQYFISVIIAMLLGSVAGGLLGFLLQQAIGQEGWAIVLGALGMCLGACFAALRRADNKLLFRGAEPAPHLDSDSAD
jgi:hypothetical protein